MSRDPFAGILDPFAWWDIARTYDKYSGVFDLVIYCSVFIAIAHVVFTSRFTGRPGKVMATVIGIALGVSLAAVERQFGWSLRSASPIAALIGLLLMGFLLLQTMVKINVPWTLAVPLTYVVIYLFLRAVTPQLVTAIADKIPFLHLLTAVMFLICVWRIGVAIWPRRHGDDPATRDDSSFISGLNRKLEEREIKAEKRMKRHLIPEVRHESARLERNLEALQRELKRDRPDLKAVAQALSDIAHRSDALTQEIDHIRILDRRIRNADYHELGELSGYYRELNEGDREKLKEQILLERRKIVQEHAIVELAERCERRQQQFRDTLEQAARACFSGDRAAVSQCISAAVATEQAQEEELKGLKTAEKRLLALTKMKLRKEG